MIAFFLFLFYDLRMLINKLIDQINDPLGDLVHTLREELHNGMEFSINPEDLKTLKTNEDLLNLYIEMRDLEYGFSDYCFDVQKNRNIYSLRKISFTPILLINQDTVTIKMENSTGASVNFNVSFDDDFLARNDILKYAVDAKSFHLQLHRDSAPLTSPDLIHNSNEHFKKLAFYIIGRAIMKFDTNTFELFLKELGTTEELLHRGLYMDYINDEKFNELSMPIKHQDSLWMELLLTKLDSIINAEQICIKMREIEPEYLKIINVVNSLKVYYTNGEVKGKKNEFIKQLN